ncbi:hypothetical protein KHA80_05510 [Anaerobacillus sp. HL2]|nr:hypothetical protein KHA80_05510 [Anaerobacillus sp. HL2]
MSDYAETKDPDRSWSTSYIRKLLQNTTYKGIRTRTFNEQENSIKNINHLKLLIKPNGSGYTIP